MALFDAKYMRKVFVLKPSPFPVLCGPALAAAWLRGDCGCSILTRASSMWMQLFRKGGGGGELRPGGVGAENKPESTAVG